MFGMAWCRILAEEKKCLAAAGETIDLKVGWGLQAVSQGYNDLVRNGLVGWDGMRNLGKCEASTEKVSSNEHWDGEATTPWAAPGSSTVAPTLMDRQPPPAARPAASSQHAVWGINLVCRPRVGGHSACSHHTTSDVCNQQFSL